MSSTLKGHLELSVIVVLKLLSSTFQKVLFFVNFLEKSLAIKKKMIILIKYKKILN